MDTVLVSLFSVVMLVVSIVVMVTTSITSVNVVSDSFQAIEKQAVSIQLTSIDLAYDSFGSGVMVMDVYNRGQSDLAAYSDWNVLVELANGQTISLTYAASQPLAGNQWTVGSIYMSMGVPEVFDIGILNPGEMMTVVLNVSPPLQPSQAVRVTVATPNGITAQCQLITPDA